MEHRILCLDICTGYGPVTPAKPRHTRCRMIYFKSCQRCSGDRSLEQDMYGWYVICLGCGYVTYPDIVDEKKSTAASRRAASG